LLIGITGSSCLCFCKGNGLFGVQTKKAPYGSVLQFLGTKEQSLTLWRAAFKKKLNIDQWLLVLDRVAEALQHIHSRGYLHNDLKANNVVLEMRYGSRYNPVIIDFGKSTRINAPKPKKCLSPADQRMYRQTYPHIAPEIVSGKGTSSTASDVYSFANLIEFVRLKAELNLGAQRVLLKNLGLSEMPDKRPKLYEFILN
jgi:serine/threonine protein kinase